MNRLILILAISTIAIILWHISPRDDWMQLLYVTLLLAFVAGSGWWARRENAGKNLRFALIWLVIFTLAALAYQLASR